MSLPLPLSTPTHKTKNHKLKNSHTHAQACVICKVKKKQKRKDGHCIFSACACILKIAVWISIYCLRYRLKGWICRYRFLLRFRWKYVVGIIAFVIGILVTIVEPPVKLLGYFLTVTGLVLGLILLVTDTVKLSQRKDSFYEIKVKSKVLRSLRMSDNYIDYQFIDFNGNRALYSSDVNLLITSTPLEFLMEKDKFKLNLTAMEIAPFAIQKAFKVGGILFNDPKVRMKSDLTVKAIKSKQKIALQRTDYFSGICTNELTCREVWTKKDRVQKYDGLSFMSSNGIILDLQQSHCSNHAGTNVLAFTKDGYMVVTIQSGETMQSPDLYAPSGSGSADFKDFEQNPETFVVSAMERELMEECGLVNDVKRTNNRIVHTHLIGFARNLNRGGKPEFFGVAYIDAPFQSLKVTRKEVMFVSDITEIRIDRSQIEELGKNLKNFRKKKRNLMSFDLYLNLVFLEDYLESCPSLFVDLISAPEN